MTVTPGPWGSDDERRHQAKIAALAHHPARLDDVSDMAEPGDVYLEDGDLLRAVRRCGPGYIVSGPEGLYYVTVAKLGLPR